MTYNICIDIGNTKVKSGIFHGEKLVELINGIDNILHSVNNKYHFKNCIISSTRKEIPKKILDLKEEFENFVILNDKMKLPISIDYKTPETLGRDRIAAAIGANSLFPNQNNIVIDAGTCVTYDFIDKNNVFRGGNISPGIYMRIKAMHEYTSNLPMVDLVVNEDFLGKSTTEALQNGAVRGTFLEISSFIQLIFDKYGSSNVIFTGGDAKYFVNNFKSAIFADQNLVLIGLNEIIRKYE